MHPSFSDLQDIFTAGVARVDPFDLVTTAVSLEGATLVVRTAEGRHRLPLDDVGRIVVIGAGKATAKMAQAVETLLGPRISDGVIAVKYGHTAPLERIRCLEAGHPLPDANGVAAAEAVARLAQEADADTLVLVLLSGGGSALWPFPAQYTDGDRSVALTLSEKQAATQALLDCGATIAETNCIRKHLSMLKGGRLAALIHPARCIGLILSDVVGDDLDVIASGPTTADATAFADAAAVVAKYDLAERLPATVNRLLRLGCDGRIPDTPAADDPIFKRVHNFLIGTNFLSLQAAAQRAQALGLHPLILSSQIVGEAREVARVLCGIARDAKKRNLLGPRPLCLVAGGETTVTIRGNGKGGRNQEMALAFLVELARDPQAAEGIYFLSASTDGTDGPTDAAGAFASTELLAAARQAGCDPALFLKNNDAYHFFERIGHLLKSGPTHTNVCDLQLLLIT